MASSWKAAACGCRGLAPRCSTTRRSAASTWERRREPIGSGDRMSALARGGECDIVVAGAGHNSLLTAAYAACAGFKVLVLEGAAQIGGDTICEELTLPGFVHDSCATAHNLIQSNPLMRNNELQLDRYGLRYLSPDPVFTMPFRDGRSITMWRDLDRTCAELARFSRGDADGYRTLLNDWQGLAPIINDEREHPPDRPALRLTRPQGGPLGPC